MTMTTPRHAAVVCDVADPLTNLSFQPVHRTIRARSLAIPNAEILHCAGEALSFAALEALANRIAHLLMAAGVAPGDLVGICLDRSLLLPVALLAVLKTGAAYVPFDPEYPQQRLNQMAEDARCKMLVTTASRAGNAPEMTAPILLLDRQRDAIEEASATDPGIAVAGTDLAYVLFTSGSTGRPKGVEVTHAGLANVLHSMSREPGLSAADTLIAVTTPCFDIAALELFLPLMVGARLVIATREETRDGVLLLDLLRRSGATAMQATPATWRLLVETDWQGAPRLRMFCGGEALPSVLAERLLPWGELWNLYGPTETTIWSSILRVTTAQIPMPIGGPIASTTFHVLDEARHPVPPGQAGELHIGGIGLARGYRGRPDLTEQRFVTLISPDGRAERVYRTGDLVRWRGDGTLDFLGRLDQQVKLHGFRIELGEIETVLAQDPAIQAAVATKQTSRQGEEQLAAFVVLRSGYDWDGQLRQRLRAALAARLPSHMRPAAIQAIAALPLTPNGKVDRTALPVAVPIVETADEPLPDPLEQRLISLWQEVLGPVPIGLDTDFFDLGGESLLAAKLLARLGQAFRPLTFGILLERPTIRTLAALLREADKPAIDPSIIVLRGGGTARPIWSISTTTIFRKLADRLAGDHPFYVLRAQDTELAALLACSSLEAVGAYYLAKLRRAQPYGPYALLGFCDEAAVAFEMALQLEKIGEAVDLLVLIDGWAPGHFARLGALRGGLAEWLYTGLSFLKRLRLMARSGRWRPFAPHLPPPPGADVKTAAAQLHHHIEHRLRDYRPGPFGGNALVVRSTAQPTGPLLPRDLGWRELVRGRLAVVEVDGDHLSIFAEPGVDALADGISAFTLGIHAT